MTEGAKNCYRLVRTTGALALLLCAGGVLGAPVTPATPERSPRPSALRGGLLERVMLSPMCWPANLTESQWNQIVHENGGLPPTFLGNPEDPALHYFTDGVVWTGVSSQGGSGLALPASLTYSFPNDGVTWGLSEISDTGPNALNAQLIALFGTDNLDLGREWIRQGFVSWRLNAGLTYQEVADDNTAMSQSIVPSPLRGDIRIGGLGFGTNTFLAYNAFPSAGGLSGVGGGDMCINTSFFTSDAFNSPDNNYRYLRNTVTHEHGHGIGCIHAVPCNDTKLMEPSISLDFDQVQTDDRRGAGRNYGDRYAGNHSAGDARDLGDLVSPQEASVFESALSTNGASGTGGTGEDWFRFTLAEARAITIVVDPTGGSYTNQQQLFGCFQFLPPTVNAEQAGNLSVELRSADGLSVLGSAASGGAGVTETLNAGTLAAGEYTIRVVDVGPNPEGNQTVQTYDLTVNVGSATALPRAVAGLNKRIGANQNCFFLGDIHSRAFAPSTLSAASFDWDLDGDGAYETLDAARPVTQYVSNGVYPVTLQVTDSSGKTSEDTIFVTVFGAATSLASVGPSSGAQGQSVGVTITGVNLKNVSTASEFTVSGGGVTVSGTPVPNATGTQVTGLSFVIDAGAAPGVRDVSVSNADGSATGIGLFTVLEGAGCPGDTDGDNDVDFDDLNLLLGNWQSAVAPGTSGDADGDGDVDFDDLNVVLANWQSAC